MCCIYIYMYVSINDSTYTIYIQVAGQRFLHLQLVSYKNVCIMEIYIYINIYIDI